MIADLYMALAERLATQVPALKRVTLHNDQIEDSGQHYEALHPSVTIEFTSIAWSDASRGVQTGDATISVIVASQQVGDYDHGAHSQVFALDSLRLLEDVHRALQGWSGACWGAFSRVSSEVDHRRDSVVAHVLSYRTQVTDATADILNTMVLVRPAITVHRDVDLEFPPVADGD